MKKLKPSIYNVITKENEATIVFNAKNCALVKVNNIFLELLDEPNSYKTDEYSKLAEQMYNAGFLVDDEIDELKVLEYEHNLAKHDKKKLTLTILPTLDCNFRCFYCFENKKPIKIEDTEIKAIENFAKEHIKGIEEMSVCWFGGEPLLNPTAIWKLSEIFIKLAKEENFKYKAAMITNGSLINPNIAKKMKDYKIEILQITLDGDEKTHNSRRGFINHAGSFWEIINNIQIVTDEGIKVNCRINLDKTNKDGVERLLPLLGTKNFKHFEISFGHILPLGTNDAWSKDVCYTSEEFSKVVEELGKLSDKCNLRKPLDYPFYPRPTNNFCGACQINSYVIHPNGDVYKCYDCPEYKIGDVFNGISKTMVDKNNYAHWITYSPFDDDECRNCKVLPLCMGGCPYLKEKLKNKFCLKWKNDIEDIIKAKYNSSRKS